MAVDSRNIFASVSFQQTFEAKRTNHVAELQAKEDEVRQMFVVRVKEKEAELKDSEKEVSFWAPSIEFEAKIYFFHPAACQIRETQERPRRRQA